MSNLTSTIPAFIGGVSQQSPALRLKTQCDALVNGHATVSDGLMQRPNGDLVKILGAITNPTGMKIHRIIRDVDEKYFTILTSDTTNPVRVYDLDGTAQTVRYGTLDADLNYQADANVKDYLRDGGITDAQKQIKAVTIADYTIIVNTMKATTAKAGTTSARNDAAYIYCKACHKGEYTITYRWEVDSVPGSATSSKTTAYSDGVLNYDNASLIEYFRANNPSAANITLSAKNNVLKIVPNAADAMSVSVDVTDPFGGHDLTPINFCEVDGSDKLPPQMPENVTIKVGGDADIQQDDYYMRYIFATKIWSESFGFGIEYQLEEDSLPHRLVRTAANEFTFAPIIWEDLTVGDDNTNPQPSFIGQTINNAVFGKNRIWFLSKDNVIGSAAGDYFNFFAGTVMDVLDDDPIDVAGTGQQITNYRSAKAFDGGLLLFSDEEQFALTSGEQLLTPKSAAIDATTAYNADSYAEPVKLGADVYFVSPKGSYLSLRQYTIMPDTLMKDAYDVSSHIPKYLPTGDVMMDGCNPLDMLFVHTSGDANALWIHKFLWDGDKKAQQAWYQWTFNDDIKGLFVVGTVLYCLFYDATNYFRVEKFHLENIPYSGQGFRYHLDSMVKLDNGSFDDPDTTYALTMNVGDGTGWSVINATTNVIVTTGYTLSGTTLTMTAADTSATDFFVGRDYELRMRFSQWYMRDSKDQALIAGNLVVRTLTLSFTDTGEFSIEVTPFNRDTGAETMSDSFSGVKVGESVIGEVTLLTGEETFLINAESRRTIVELVADSYLPVAIQVGAWEGTFVYRGKIT